MELIPLIIAGVVGIALGAMGYRYLLKRNPEKIEQWAAEIAALKAKMK